MTDGPRFLGPLLRDYVGVGVGCGGGGGVGWDGVGGGVVEVVVVVVIHSQTSTVQLLKFGNGYVISSHTLKLM